MRMAYADGGTMKDFRKLSVWHKAHTSVVAVYQATRSYPKDKLYGLTSQTRRASVSIAANIAEGCGRSTDADFARFLEIAAGSANEVEYHLLLACELNFLPAEEYENLASGIREVKQMLTALIRRLRGNAPH